MKLSVSLVLYKNNSELINQTLSSMLNSHIESKVYIVDNSPTPELEELCSKFPNIDYYHNPSNPGFGASHNIAISRLNSEHSPYHLILNPDVYFEPDTIPQLIEYLEEHQDVGLIQPKICFPDGKTQYLCKRYPTFFAMLGRRFVPAPLQPLIKSYADWYEMREMGYDKISEVVYLSGCFMLFRKKYFDEIGYFDDKFFMYLEDADITLRMSRKYKTIFYPQVTIFHHWARGSYNSLKLTWVMVQSVFYFFNKHGWKFF
jgi:GT2 family glycosyltransferase